MQLTIKGSILGIELSLGDGSAPKPLEPSPTANQDKPRRNYVYAHLDKTGKVFYIGKGTGRRAWSQDRHYYWTWYVERHLKGDYRVQILHDDLTPEEAERLEATWLTQFGDEIVNWVHWGRTTDFKALELFHKLRDANRELLAEAKKLERTDLEGAARIYIRAIEAISTYAFIKYEGGLLGRLMDEENAEFGHSGDFDALNRLTMCLCKLGRAQEALDHSESYYSKYRRDRRDPKECPIAKRIAKAFAKSKKSPSLHST